MNGFQVARSVASWLWGQDQKRALKYVEEMEQAFSIRKKLAYLVTFGSCDHGDEWNVVRIFDTREKAEKYVEEFDTVTREDGSTYSNDYRVEEWEVF